MAQQSLAAVRDHEAVADGCAQRGQAGNERIDQRQRQRVPECNRRPCDPGDGEADRSKQRRYRTEDEASHSGNSRERK